MGGVGTPSTPEAATSGSTTTIVKSSATYTPNAFVGYQVAILGGTGQGQTCVVIGNTADYDHLFWGMGNSLSFDDWESG